MWQRFISPWHNSWYPCTQSHMCEPIGDCTGYVGKQYETQIGLRSHVNSSVGSSYNIIIRIHTQTYCVLTYIYQWLHYCHVGNVLDQLLKFVSCFKLSSQHAPSRLAVLPRHKDSACSITRIESSIFTAHRDVAMRHNNIMVNLALYYVLMYVGYVHT